MCRILRTTFENKIICKLFWQVDGSIANHSLTLRVSRTNLSHVLCFYSFRTENLARESWIIINLLNVSASTIAEYFYLLFVVWLALQARQNTAKLVILSDSTHQTI